MRVRVPPRPQIIPDLGFPDFDETVTGSSQSLFIIVLYPQNLLKDILREQLFRALPAHKLFEDFEVGLFS